MGKTQEHSDDVRRKVGELHKSGNGYEKISKPLIIPISIIMAIVKTFTDTREVKNQPGRGRVCTLTPRTVRRMVQLAKESSRITAGELQKLVESWGQKVYKSTSPQVVWEGCQKKASAVNQQQTKAPTDRKRT